MPKYRVVLNGENYLLSAESGVAAHGFYTTRYVEAPTPEQAEQLVLGLVRGDPELTASVVNPPDDPPRILVDELAELESFDGVEVLGGGYTFYLVKGDVGSIATSGQAPRRNPGRIRDAANLANLSQPRGRTLSRPMQSAQTDSQ